MSKSYEENPGTRPIPADDFGPLIRNFKDREFGKFKVVGYYGYSERECMNGGRELYDDERDLWVVQCSCGLYYLFDHAYVKMQIDHKKRCNQMCVECKKNLK